MLASGRCAEAGKQEHLSAILAPGRRIARLCSPPIMKKRKVLVVDIGGTNVKLLMSLQDKVKNASGSRMKPKEFVAEFKEVVRGWKFDAISIVFPAPVRHGRIT